MKDEIRYALTSFAREVALTLPLASPACLDFREATHYRAVFVDAAWANVGPHSTDRLARAVKFFGLAAQLVEIDGPALPPRYDGDALAAELARRHAAQLALYAELLFYVPAPADTPWVQTRQPSRGSRGEWTRTYLGWKLEAHHYGKGAGAYTRAGTPAHYTARAEATGTGGYREDHPAKVLLPQVKALAEAWAQVHPLAEARAAFIDSLRA